MFLADADLEPVVIWGSGAIGGTIGAYLRHAGREVMFVDIVPEHVKMISARQLRVSGPNGTLIQGGPAFLPEEMRGQHRLILLAVKSQHTMAAANALLPFLHPDGAVVSCQNGLNEADLSQVIGKSRTVGCFVNFGADYHAPGQITYGLAGAVVVGELNGKTTPRIEALQTLLKNFEPDTKVSNNIIGYLWGKMAYGALLKFTALENETIAETFSNIKWRSSLITLAREVLSVAVAEGVTPLGFDGFDPDAFLKRDNPAIERSFKQMVGNNQGSGKPHTGVWRDLAIRRRPTEVSAQAQPILKAAERHNINLSMYRKLVLLIEELEAGNRVLGTNVANEMLAVGV